MTGEQVIYEAQLHGIVYLPPAIVALLGFALLIGAPSNATAILVLIVAGICSIWCVGIHGGRQFILTSKRVIVKKGIIERKVNELMLRKCEGIQVEQSILGRIFNFNYIYKKKHYG